VQLERSEISKRIRTQVAALASRLGNDASSLGDDELLPATGLLDSAAILELVVWYEDAFEIPLTQDEINIDNLGSIDAMVNFVLTRRAE
jgi:acyl carrier protein